MKFKSTREANVSCTAAEAIKAGISHDGGLFVPECFPAVTAEEIRAMVGMGYKERAAFILGRYLTDYSAEEIKSYCEAAYRDTKWGGADTAPTVKLDETASICELWHGPTCAFKDIALQMLPHLLAGAVRKTGEDKTVVILVATSGDTGKAALDGFCDVDGTKIIVFYPEKGVSNIQKLQMTTQDGSNVYVAAINGNFDNAQSGVKAIFGDREVEAELSAAGYKLSSANSINFGRLVPQVVYYFSSYCDLVARGEIEIGDKINFCVPTGNFGNILAGFYAKQMGLPVAKLICASNENNILTDFIQTGVYDRNRNFYLTASPSMDILISSNLERLLFHLSGGDAALTADYMKQLAETGRYEVTDAIRKAVAEHFSAGFCDDDATRAVIGKTYAEHKYVCDTHTAVAVGVYRDYAARTGDSTKTVIMSTASPFKFSGDVLKGLGVSEELSDFDKLDKLESFGIQAPAQLAGLKNKSVRFDKVFDKSEMLSAVREFLQF